MGIQGLAAFLKSKCPRAFTRFDNSNDVLTRFSGRTVVCDAAGYLHKYAYVHQNAETAETDWDGVFESVRKLAHSFASQNVSLVFVFDGTKAMKAKRFEHALRAESRINVERSVKTHNEKVAKRRKTEAEAAAAAPIVAGSLDTGVDSTLAYIQKLAEAQCAALATESPQASVIDAPVDEPAEFRKHPVHVKHNEIKRLRKYLLANGIGFYDALGEGEHLAAMLARSSMPQFAHIAAVLSDDLDSLACGAPFTIRFWRNAGAGTGASKHMPTEIISLQSVLETLQLTYPQFVDYCVLCGSDFTDGKLPGVGPVAALRIVRDFGSLDGVAARPGLALGTYRHPKAPFQCAAEVWPRFDYKTARHFLSAVDFMADGSTHAVDPRLWIRPSAFALIETWVYEHWRLLVRRRDLAKFVVVQKVAVN
jgi:5'-3' exonuclease